MHPDNTSASSWGTRRLPAASIEGRRGNCHSLRSNPSCVGRQLRHLSARVEYLPAVRRVAEPTIAHPHQQVLQAELSDAAPGSTTTAGCRVSMMQGHGRQADRAPADAQPPPGGGAIRGSRRGCSVARRGAVPGLRPGELVDRPAQQRDRRRCDRSSLCRRRHTADSRPAAHLALQRGTVSPGSYQVTRPTAGCFKRPFARRSTGHFQRHEASEAWGQTTELRAIGDHRSEASSEASV